MVYDWRDMHQNASPKVVFITGASAGIGAATTRALLATGATVYAAARRVERMDGLAELGARTIACDVTDDAAMVAAIERVRTECGRLGVLINNAGYGSYGALEDVPLDEARRQFEVNLFGAARLTQLALPLMRAQKRGTIINISSMGGKMYEPFGSWYHATKFALEGLSDCLRLELAPLGIDVVIIEPGGIKTEWGTIAIDSLIERSGSTAYGERATAWSRVLVRGDLTGSDPSVIANAIVRAVRARRPKTRYVAGAFAAPILFARRVLPDRAMDGVMKLLGRSMNRPF